MIAYETMYGTIRISEAYLSKLIGHEVTSCFGVVGMVPSNNRQRFTKIFSRKEQPELGISVTGDAENVTVELHITVIYGMNINAIAASITEKVKYVVMENAGVNVKRVIVRIDGMKD